jgi:hypothetical protein
MMTSLPEIAQAVQVQNTQKNADNEKKAIERERVASIADEQKVVQWFTRCINKAAKGADSAFLSKVAAEGRHNVDCAATLLPMEPYYRSGRGCNIVRQMFFPHGNSLRLPTANTRLKYFEFNLGAHGACSLLIDWE